MYSAEDLFVNEDQDENDLERIIEGNSEQQDGEILTEENDGENENEDNDENEEKKEVVKAKKVVRNPRPKLNVETLKGPRGLTSLEKVFERVQFKGPGHEEEDLNVLLKTYEYWCHRLFPKLPFDDCIDKIEKLGHKKPVQTLIKKIRLGMVVDEDDKIEINSDEDLDNEQPTSDFDVLQSTNQLEPTLQEPNTEIVDLTEQQLERIRENKLRAWNLRQEKLQKIQEKADSTIAASQSSSNETNGNPQPECSGSTSNVSVHVNNSIELTNTDMIEIETSKQINSNAESEVFNGHESVSSQEKNNLAEKSDGECEQDIDNILDVVNENKGESQLIDSTVVPEYSEDEDDIDNILNIVNDEDSVENNVIMGDTEVNTDSMKVDQ